MYGELQDEPPNLLVDENTAYPHVDKAFDLTYGLSDKLGSWWNQPSPPAWVDVISMFDVEPIGYGRAYVLSVLKWRAAQLGVCFILRKVFRLHAISYCTRADPRWLRKTLTCTKQRTSNNALAFHNTNVYHFFSLSLSLFCKSSDGFIIDW